jgi:hypothetical protein
MTKPMRTGGNITAASRASEDDVGRSIRPKGGYQPGIFQHVESVSDFARVLGVPVDSIKLIVQKKDVKCKSSDCPFDAIEGNGDRCPAHQRSWYPLRGERGSDLLGPEFMRFNGKFRLCDCSQDACRSAGYFPNQDPIAVSVEGREVVMKTPGLFNNAQKAILDERTAKTIYLHPWHFFPEHRLLSNGKWKLRWKKNLPNVYRDPTGKDSYPFPPPRNTIRRFLEDEYFSSYVHPQDRWMDSDSNNLPRWLQRMIDLDKAAASSAATSANPSHPTNSFTSPVPVQRSTSTLQIPSATSEP